MFFTVSKSAWNRKSLRSLRSAPTGQAPTRKERRPGAAGGSASFPRWQLHWQAQLGGHHSCLWGALSPHPPGRLRCLDPGPAPAPSHQPTLHPGKSHRQYKDTRVGTHLEIRIWWVQYSDPVTINAVTVPVASDTFSAQNSALSWICFPRKADDMDDVSTLLPLPGQMTLLS